MIKNSIVFTLIGILLLTLPALGETFAGKCVGVSDGDTIRVMKNGISCKVRVDAIDCPELHQDFGNRAKKFTSSLVYGRIVTVDSKKIDRYGRIVGRVKIDGKALSLELVKAGLAWHYKKYSDDPVLADAEKQARARRIGLWSMPHPVPPWEYRHGK